MAYCDQCGTQAYKDSRFCPSCGASVEPPIHESTAPVERSGSLKRDAVLLLVAAGFGFIASFTLIGLSPVELGKNFPAAMRLGRIYLAVGIPLLVPSILALIGGMKTRNRASFNWAIAGGIGALFCGGVVLGVLSLVYICKSAKEFGYRDRIPVIMLRVLAISFTVIGLIITGLQFALSDASMPNVRPLLINLFSVAYIPTLVYGISCLWQNAKPHVWVVRFLRYSILPIVALGLAALVFGIWQINNSIHTYPITKGLYITDHVDTGLTIALASIVLYTLSKIISRSSRPITQDDTSVVQPGNSYVRFIQRVAIATMVIKIVITVVATAVWANALGNYVSQDIFEDIIGDVAVAFIFITYFASIFFTPILLYGFSFILKAGQHSKTIFGCNIKQLLIYANIAILVSGCVYIVIYTIFMAMAQRMEITAIIGSIVSFSTLIAILYAVSRFLTARQTEQLENNEEGSA